MDGSARQEGDLTFLTRNSTADIYWGLVFSQCLSPFIWIYLAIFAWMNYGDALPLARMGEWRLGLLLAAKNVLISIGVVYLVSLINILVMRVTGRLRGVIGEHEYVFGADRFTEKSALNEQTAKYDAITNFAVTRRHYLLKITGGIGFIFPKRDLDETTTERLRERLRGVKPLRRTFVPYVAFLLFLSALAGVLVVAPMRKHTLMSWSIPFRAVWNAEELYVHGGRIITGESTRYGDLLRFTPPDAPAAEPRLGHEHFLWVMRNGRTERHVLPATQAIDFICLGAGKLYALQSDPRGGGSSVGAWSGSAFVDAPDIDPDKLLELCSPGSDGPSPVPGEERNAIHAGEWDRRVGHGKPLEIRLGDSRYELRIVQTEGAVSPVEGLFADVDMGSIALSGRWVDGGGGTETLYEATFGSRAVGRKEFESALAPARGR